MCQLRAWGARHVTSLCLSFHLWSGSVAPPVCCQDEMRVSAKPLAQDPADGTRQTAAVTISWLPLSRLRVPLFSPLPVLCFSLTFQLNKHLPEPQDCGLCQDKHGGHPGAARWLWEKRTQRPGAAAKLNDARAPRFRGGTGRGDSHRACVGGEAEEVVRNGGRCLPGPRGMCEGM